MQQSERFTAAEADARGKRIMHQIEKCLRHGCVIRIEHAPAVAPRFTRWEEWCKPCCYDGNPQEVFGAIERCREAHGDHHIRLVLEDFSCHSRFAFVVHDPVTAAA